MCWSSFFLGKGISMPFEEAARIAERSPVGPRRSQHQPVLYKRRLRYWLLIPLAWNSRRLLKASRAAAKRISKHHRDLRKGSALPIDETELKLRGCKRLCLGVCQHGRSLFCVSRLPKGSIPCTASRGISGRSYFWLLYRA